MEEKISVIESLFEQIEQYAKGGVELYKLKIVDKSSDTISLLLTHLIISIVIAFFFLFLNIGAAFWIGNVLGQSYYGFFLVAAFYAFVGWLLYAFRRRLLKKPIRNSIITQFLN